MYITIDGASGAGKTTQAFLLHQHLGLEYTCFLNVKYLVENVPIITGSESPYAELIAALTGAHTIPTDIDCIVEDFWSPFRHLHNLHPNDLKRVIVFFQTGITLGGRRTPDLSIYLSIPYDVHVKRVFHRHTRGEIQPAFDKENMTSYEALNRFWGTIAEQVDYFHVIDGTLPEEEVNNLITALINGGD